MQTDSENYEFLLDNLFFVNIDGPEVQKGKVNVVLTVKRTARGFELNFQTEGTVMVPCDRCLDEMEMPVATTDKLAVRFGREYGEDGDVIIIPEDEGDINIAWFIYEFIALAVPMKHVHAPGKCNKSMTGKLNKHLRINSYEEKDDDFDSGDEDIIFDMGNEEEIEKPTDPRWNDLKKILDNN